MDKKKTIIITILALAGFALTIELAYIFFKVNFNETFSASFCSVNSLIDCDGVAKTNYSLFLGVPLALWGMFFYALTLFLNYVHLIQNKFKNTIFDVFKNPKSYIAALGLLSFAISMCLATISIFKINKICVLCFVTYFIDLFIALCAKTKGSFFFVDIKNTVSDFIDGVKKYTVLFLIVLFAFIGFLTYTNVSLVFSPQQKIQKSFDEFIKMDKNKYAVSGNVMGNPNGDKIYVYSDFMCPFCRVTNIMVSKFAHEEKRIMVIHENYPLDMECNKYIPHTVHPGACTLARYALAAKRQNKYWDMANLIFDEHPSSEADILKLSQKIDIDIAKLVEDVSSKEVQDELLAQIDGAYKRGIFGTPTIVIDDIPYTSAMPYYKIKTLYAQALRRHQRAGN